MNGYAEAMNDTAKLIADRAKEKRMREEIADLRKRIEILEKSTGEPIKKGVKNA